MTNLELIDMIYSIMGTKYTKIYKFYKRQVLVTIEYSVDISKINYGIIIGEL